MMSEVGKSLLAEAFVALELTSYLLLHEEYSFEALLRVQGQKTSKCGGVKGECLT